MLAACGKSQKFWEKGFDWREDKNENKKAGEKGVREYFQGNEYKRMKGSVV